MKRTQQSLFYKAICILVILLPYIISLFDESSNDLVEEPPEVPIDNFIIWMFGIGILIIFQVLKNKKK